MQDLSPFLDQALIFFAYTTTVVVVVVSVFLIKLLIELSELAKISQKVAYMLKNEFEPTVIELQKALRTINSVAGNADKKVENIKQNLSSIINPLNANIDKFKVKFLQGLNKGINWVLKKD